VRAGTDKAMSAVGMVSVWWTRDMANQSSRDRSKRFDIVGEGYHGMVNEAEVVK
jgi:hypothetical protein